MKTVLLIFIYVLMVANTMFWIGIAGPKFKTCDLNSGECFIVLMVLLIFSVTPFVLFWLAKKLFRYIFKQRGDGLQQDHPKIFQEGIKRKAGETRKNAIMMSTPMRVRADSSENKVKEPGKRIGFFVQIFNPPTREQRTSSVDKKRESNKRTGFFNDIFGPPG